MFWLVQRYPTPDFVAHPVYKALDPEAPTLYYEHEKAVIGASISLTQVDSWWRQSQFCFPFHYFEIEPYDRRNYPNVFRLRLKPGAIDTGMTISNLFKTNIK